MPVQAIEELVAPVPGQERVIELLGALIVTVPVGGAVSGKSSTSVRVPAHAEEGVVTVIVVIVPPEMPLTVGVPLPEQVEFHA